MLGCLCAALLLAGALPAPTRSPAGRRRAGGPSAQRPSGPGAASSEAGAAGVAAVLPAGVAAARAVSGGLLAAVGLGVTIVSLEALVAALLYGLPTAGFVRWALLPAAPLLLLAVGAGVLAWRARRIFGQCPNRGMGVRALERHLAGQHAI